MINYDEKMIEMSQKLTAKSHTETIKAKMTETFGKKKMLSSLAYPSVFKRRLYISGPNS